MQFASICLCNYLVTIENVSVLSGCTNKYTTSACIYNKSFFPLLVFRKSISQTLFESLVLMYKTCVSVTRTLADCCMVQICPNNSRNWIQSTGNIRHDSISRCESFDNFLSISGNHRYAIRAVFHRIPQTADDPRYIRGVVSSHPFRWTAYSFFV